MIPMTYQLELKQPNRKSLQLFAVKVLYIFATGSL